MTEIWLKSPRGFGQTAPKCGQKRAVFRHHNNLVFWPLIQQRFRILVEAITAVNWCSGAYTCKKLSNFRVWFLQAPECRNGEQSRGVACTERIRIQQFAV